MLAGGTETVSDKPGANSRSCDAEGGEREEARAEGGAEGPQQPRLSSYLWGFPFGVVSGVLSGALNEGGPPVVVYLALRGLPKDETKAALQAYFLCISIYTLPLLQRSGLLQARHLYYDAIGEHGTRLTPA